MIKLTPLLVLAFSLLLANTKILAGGSELPLSPKEISQLQHLFSSSTKDKVSHFALTPPPEHIVWQQTPINVSLPVGKERLVNFPVAVEFGYDKNVLPDNLLRVQNNNGTLYLLAKAPFTIQRVQVRCSNEGKIILLNLSAQKEASTTPLDIVLPHASSALFSDVTHPLKQQDTETIDSTLGYLTLTRFAAQQLYAPKRLLTQPNTIYRTPMHTTKTVILLRDQSVLAMPLASWRRSDLTVTAVLLRNQLSQSLTLDPRNLCEEWRAATFFPHTLLAPAGQRADSTTVFLIANRSFADALASCQRGF